MHGWRAWKKWFFTFITFLAPVIFLIHDILKKDQKMTGAKKFIKAKNQLFKACQPCKGIFKIYVYWCLFFWTVFSKLWIFSEKSFLLVSSISGLMSLKIWQPWMNSTVQGPSFSSFFLCQAKGRPLKAGGKSVCQMRDARSTTARPTQNCPHKYSVLRTILEFQQPPFWPF